MSFEAIKKQEQEYILHSYGRVDVALSHGKNAEAWDVEGKHYYDFTSGIGVNALGYSDEGWVKAVTEQAGKIQHMSNYYYCDKTRSLRSCLQKTAAFAVRSSATAARRQTSAPLRSPVSTAKRSTRIRLSHWKIPSTAERSPHWQQRVRTAFISFSPR